MKTIYILGAGIQGICSAFELSDIGYDVTLVEKADDVFARTSLNQEGRVHMGFTYALDRGGKTGEMMMHSALSFSGLMERWVGKIDWNTLLLDKGYYLIHKDESLLNEEEILSYYDRLQDTYYQLLEEDSNASYFGRRPEKIFNALSDLPTGVSGQKVCRAIHTEEQIVELFKLRDVLVDNLKRRNIKILTNTSVESVERDNSGFIVNTSASDNENDKQRLKADIVVNCLWNNRIKIDKTIGLPEPTEALYRFKIGLFGKVTKPVLNCTIVSGAFGNISPRMDGTYAYISWHTDCMKEMTTNATTPKSWEDYFTNDQTKELKSKWVADAIHHMTDFLPAASTFTPIKLLPGIICSAGKTDIDDIASNVHKRAEKMGIYSSDDYYSVNTGKFSSAPLLAYELAKLIGNTSDTQQTTRATQFVSQNY